MSGKRYLILGKDGMLGKDLQAALYDRDFVGFNAEELDIRNADAIKTEILNMQPDVIINAAAYTNVEKAEEEIVIANEVNGYAVGKLANICRNFGITLVHFSTDYVFNCQNKYGYREEDSPDPINAYGKSKLLGEQLLVDEMEHEIEGLDQEEGRFYLIRTSYLIGKYGVNILKKLLDNAQKLVPFKVIQDQFTKVTFAADLAKQVKWLVECNEYESGIYHITNSGVLNWLEFAKTLLAEAGFNPDLAIPCSMNDWVSKAKRPQYSTLLNTKLPELRHWREALKEYLK